MDAKHVGKHSTEREEMCDSSPKMVASTAQPSATTWIIRAYVRYFVMAVGMLKTDTLKMVFGSGH